MRNAIAAFSSKEVFKDVQSLGQESDELKCFEFETITVNRHGEIIERETKKAQYSTQNLANNVILEMVAIPGGTFLMGSPNIEAGSSGRERPQHEVTVPPFFMSKYLVTQAQWRTVAALPQVNLVLDPDPSYFKGDDRPVETISWYEAVEFCDRISKHAKKHYQLPSEAEWEYACRAGTTTPFHYGETITSDIANLKGTSASASEGIYRQSTTSVGTFFPNAFGLYDMHGNVWEWCADKWHSNYNVVPQDATDWIMIDSYDNGRVLRGGSWLIYPRNCRSASRSGI